VGGENGVEFLGYVTDEELGELYRGAICVIVPSLMEGFGLPALEAMERGALVVTSNISSLREICRDAALYFDPNSTDDMSRMMMDVYKKKNKFRINKNKGLARAKDFSWEMMAEQTLKVYESCVSL